MLPPGCRKWQLISPHCKNGTTIWSTTLQLSITLLDLWYTQCMPQIVASLMIIIYDYNMFTIKTQIALKVRVENVIYCIQFVLQCIQIDIGSLLSLVNFLVRLHASAVTFLTPPLGQHHFSPASLHTVIFAHSRNK